MTQNDLTDGSSGQDLESQPAEFKGRVSAGTDWREIVALVSDLPPMPQVATKALRMVENPDTTARQLTEVLSTDISLAARVLKIANSAMFARQREITTLVQAITIIGFKALKGVIVGAALRQLAKKFDKAERLVWANSMCTALFATALGKRIRPRYLDELYLNGILHSLGQVALLFSDPTAPMYGSVLKTIEEKQVDYVTAEHEVFGFAHPLIGALVAKKWNFSEETCQVILHCKDTPPALLAESEIDVKTGIIALAHLLSHELGAGSPKGYPSFTSALKPLAQYVGFDVASIDVLIEDVMVEVRTQFERDSGVFS